MVGLGPCHVRTFVSVSPLLLFHLKLFSRSPHSHLPRLQFRKHNSPKIPRFTSTNKYYVIIKRSSFLRIRASKSVRTILAKTLGAIILIFSYFLSFFPPSLMHFKNLYFAPSFSTPGFISHSTNSIYLLEWGREKKVELNTSKKLRRNFIACS